MLIKSFIALILLMFTVSTEASVEGYITNSDKKKLLKALSDSFVLNNADYTSSFYGARGYELLGEKINAAVVKDNCAQLKKFYNPEHASELQFQALNSWKSLGCTGNLHTDASLQKLRQTLENDKASTTELRYAAEALEILGVNVPNPGKIAQLVQSALKEDDSLLSMGNALHLSSLLENAGKFMLDRIEEIVVQADEVDGKLLQWEGGLTTTSLLMTGLLKVDPVKSLNQEQANKLASYLLTRRTVQTPKGVLALLEAAHALIRTNLSPIAIAVDGAAQVTTDKPELKVHISDLLGNKLKTTPSPVIAQSATRITDDVVVLSKQPLSPSANPVEFILPLKLEPSQYRVVLTVGNQVFAMIVRVLGPVSLDSLEVGLGDADSLPELTKLAVNSKLSSLLKADPSQHLIVKFTISRKVHQAFLRLFSGKKEIIFVAETDNNKLYKLDVNLAAELSYSGTYKMELILGDSVMSNPIRWELGSLSVNLKTTEPTEKPKKGPKPEINHLFRPAEKRPPPTVSLIFSALTAAPLLLLFILWGRIGINFENFSPKAIPFHLGLGAILALFTLFWLKLDMFTTCFWLLPLGAFTFLSGQAFLSYLASLNRNNKQKTQ